MCTNEIVLLKEIVRIQELNEGPAQTEEDEDRTTVALLQ